MTNEDIQHLIKTPKRIHKKNPQKGYKAEKGHRRCDLILYYPHLQIQDSTTGKSHTGLKQEFKIFIRQNQTFIENFSIGLCYHVSSLKNSVRLIRYNGPHGQTRRNTADHHSYHHIHRISQKEIQSGSLNLKEKNIEITNKYSAYEEGLRSFLIDVNVINWKDWFPELEQRRFSNGY